MTGCRSRRRTAFLERLFGSAPKAAPGDAVGVQNDIRAQPKGKVGYVAETFVDFDHAYQLSWHWADSLLSDAGGRGDPNHRV